VFHEEMMSTRDRTRGTTGSRLALRLIALVGMFTACATDAVVAPVLPPRAPMSAIRPLAFTADVNLATGRVVITAPTATSVAGVSPSRAGAEQPSLSLLGGEAIRLVPTNYQASPVGAYAPNKVRVTFDVGIENKLPGVALTTPTWPVPPASGVILFPLDYVVTTTPGGVVGGAGNEVIVEVPSTGLIAPSVDWNGTGTTGSGAPFNFFNDDPCALATSNDCFRWKMYEASIAPLSMSSSRTVGFDIDASVAQFRTRLVVAADLAASAAPAPGIITGTISAITRGALSGVIVTTSGGQSTTTDATGAYTLPGLAPGSVTVSLGNLPAGCTVPPALPVLVSTGATTGADIAVTCAPLPATISGVITSSLDNAPIAGARVFVAGVANPVESDVDGHFTIAGAPPGTGSLGVTGLYAGCTAATLPYTASAGATATVNVVATCVAPPAAGYQYSTAWSADANGNIEVELRIDMRTLNRPDVADVTTGGATGDALRAVQVALDYDPAQLTLLSADVATDARPLNLIVNTALAGHVTAIASIPSGGRTGLSGIARLVFTRGPAGTAGATVTLTTTSVTLQVLDTTGSPIAADAVNLSTPFVVPPVP
jgi:hypothetical protein